jgi:hypothetical protein
MTGFISSSPFQNTKPFLQIQSLAPGIARRSSERFQLRRVTTPNPPIVYRIRGYRCVCLVEGFVGTHSVRRLDSRISGNRRICSRLRRWYSSQWDSSMDFNLVIHFFSPPCIAPLSPHRPPAARPPNPARARPAPARGAAVAIGRGSRAAWARPGHDGGGQALPCAAPYSFLPWPWFLREREEREEDDGSSVN